MSQYIFTLLREGIGKIWLEPQLKTTYLYNFTKAEEKKILEIIELNLEFFKTKWNEHFIK